MYLYPHQVAHGGPSNHSESDTSRSKSTSGASSRNAVKTTTTAPFRVFGVTYSLELRRAMVLFTLWISLSLGTNKGQFGCLDIV